MTKRLISAILIFLHIALIVAPDIFAMSSVSYKLEGAVDSGGNSKGASNSYFVALDSIGAAACGVSTSASYKVNSGFIYQVLSNPPEFKGIIPNQSWKENTRLDLAFDLDDYFSAENPPLVYVVKYETPNNKITAAIDPSTNKLSFSQPAAFYGTETISFRATDAEGNSVWSNSVQLTVEGVENAPVMDFIPDIVVNENEPVEIAPHATDLDGDAITYSFTAPLDSQGSWQTDYASAGTYTVTVTATDDSAAHLYARQDVKITVKDVNRPPVFTAAAEVSPSSPKEGDIITITPQVSDPDGNTLIYYYTEPFDSQGKWITDYNDTGSYAVILTASDGIETIHQDINITVTNVNRAPQAALTVSDNTVNPNDPVTINLSATDPDNDAITYIIEAAGAQIASGTISGAANVNKSFSNPGDYTIKATVTDINSDPKSATAETVINVIDPNLNRDSIQPILGDFNGDALTDLGSHNIDNGKWDISLSDAGVFNYTENWLSDFGASRDWIPISGDFNGDAYTDTGIYNNTNGECKIALNNKDKKFTDSGLWIKFSDASYDWQPLTADFNNDGKTDIAVYNPKTGELRFALSGGAKFDDFTSRATGLSDSADWQPILADVNADSLVDLVLFNKNKGDWNVALYTGNSFINTGVWLSGFAKDKSPVLADFNNDATTDVGYWDKDSASIKYAISTGSKFIDKGVFKDKLPPDKGDFVYIADFNGDSLSDIAFFNKDRSGIEAWHVMLADSKPPDLLIKVENGTGGRVEITYDYAAKADNALLPFPVYVVTKIAAVDMLPVNSPEESYTQLLSYTGGWFDADEREFRGFRAATVTDPLTGNYSKTYFHQGKSPEDGSLKGKTQKIEAYDGNGKLISRTENAWDVKKGGPLADGIGFPQLVSTKNTVNEENNISVATEDVFTYDRVGNVTEATTKGDISKTGDERTTRTNYNLPYQDHNTPNLVQLLDENLQIKNQSSFEYDSYGNLTKQTVYIDGTDNDPFTTYTYDDYGNVLTQTDALGRTTSTTYDDTIYAYPVSVINVLGQSASTIYDYKLGIAISVTDANSNTSEAGYDSLARPVWKKNAFGDIIVTYEYPDFNTKITTSAGITSKEYIDGLGRRYLAKTQGEDGDNSAWITTEVIYNARGAVDSESLPHYENDTERAYTRYEYDIRGRVKKVIADFTGVTKDAELKTDYLTPLSVRSTDANGNRKDTIKDVYGRNIEIIEKTQAGDYHTYYEYDLKDSLTKVTDNQGNITTIQYDTLGKKTSMNDPDMGVWSYEYDKVGNLIKQTDAKNQIIEFEYDQLNRLFKKHLRGVPQDSSEVEYGYDDAFKSNCIGRLSKVTDASGSTEFFYDKLGREIKSIKTVPGTNPVPGSVFIVQREYDTFGRLTKLTYPDNEAVVYLYDSNSGLLESVVGNSTYASNIAYNAKGQMLNINYGNGTNTIYTYGQDLRLSNILTKNSAQTQLQNLYYNFDKNGNLTSLTDNITAQTRTYEYDDLDRLTYARNIPTPDGFGQDQNFRYDSIGNMTYKSDVGTFVYGQGAGPHAVTTAGGINYFYDANGNMASGRNKTLEYDVENRLIKVTESGKITSFTYDRDGGRVKKLLQTPSSELSTTYIGSFFETDSDGTTRKHIFAGVNRIATVSGTNQVPDTVAYYHTDHLGSSNIITDSTGQVAQHCEYNPYGTLSVNTGTDVVKHKFTGKELDASTGLYFYAWRYYDPALGRFTQPDTIVPNPNNPQDFNRYSYCNNNPINYVDPSGHSWFSKFIKRWGSTILSVAAIVAAPFSGGASLAFFAASSIMGGIQASQQGQLGAWAAGFAVSLAIGVAIPSPNFGNLGMQVGVGAIRGAAIGAVSGGVASMVGGGSFGAGAGQGAIGGAAAGGLGSLMTSQQMGNLQGGRGFVNNATASRIASMRSSLGLDRNAMVSATRGMQAAESGSGLAAEIGAALKDRGNILSDYLGHLSDYVDVVGLSKIGTAFQSASVYFSDMGPFATGGMIIGGGAGIALGLPIAPTGAPVWLGIAGAAGGAYTGNKIDNMLNIDWQWTGEAY